MARRSCLASLAQALSDGAFFFGIAASPRSRAGLSGPPRGDYPPDPSIHVALSPGGVSIKLEINEKDSFYWYEKVIESNGSDLA